MPNCPNVLSRGICTDSTCRLEHKILICEPCGFIASNENAYTAHLQGQRHKSRIAGRSIALYCPVCEMNIEGGVWASHKAGSSHLKQATQKGLSADVEPQEGTDGQGQKYCEICKLVVDNSKWARHLRSAWHLKRKDFASYQAAISDAEKDKNGITARGNLDFGIIDVNKTKKTAGCAITLKAITANVRVKLTDVKLASSRANTEAAFTVALEGDNRNISSGTSLKILVTLNETNIGRYEDRLEMSLQDLRLKKTFFISRIVRVIIGDRVDHEQLKASVPYTPYSAAPKKPIRKIIEGEQPPALTSIPYIKILPQAPIPKPLHEALSEGSTAEIMEKIRRSFLPHTLNSRTHARYFKILLWVEEQRAEQDLERYDIADAKLKKDGFLYFVEVPGLAEKRPSVLLGDRILVQPRGAPEGLWYSGYVHTIREKEVGLRFNKLFKTSQHYHIRFKLNRITLRRQHYALATKFQEDRFLFPTIAPSVSGGNDTDKRKLSYYNHNIATNQQQQQAIRSIVSLPPGSPPFVLFGPFGTGKTSTIIEAILQILDANDEARVLACAPSNSAADLITMKLSAHLNDQKLFRYNAPSRREKDVPAEVLKYSHFVPSSDKQSSHFGIPMPVDRFKLFKVVVSTCISASVSDAIGIPRGHFTHIFIDEAGQATEPESLVSIKTLADAKTNIVLTGDPKQLGPVIQSRIAGQLGLQISYLERLMEREAYNLENHNGVTVVKLLNNYRSHPAILKFPNEQFYNGELIAAASAEKIGKYLGSPILPCSKFPIVFHAISGKDEREASSPSFFNKHEAIQVKLYVRMLQTAKKYQTSGKDIGIITPYYAQSLKIRKLLNGVEGIKVGSVEEFQGQERPVIIISTVRSSQELTEFDIRHTLGFVANPRRFNVAITRCQALLIIVGDPRVLSLDPLWRSFLNYVYKNRGWRGPLPSWNTEEEVDFDGGYDKKISQQAQLDMNEFTRRMESLTMDGIDDESTGVDLREE